MSKWVEGAQVGTPRLLAQGDESNKGRTSKAVGDRACSAELRRVSQAEQVVPAQGQGGSREWRKEERGGGKEGEERGGSKEGMREKRTRKKLRGSKALWL